MHSHKEKFVKRNFRTCRHLLLQTRMLHPDGPDHSSWLSMGTKWQEIPGKMSPEVANRPALQAQMPIEDVGHLLPQVEG